MLSISTSSLLRRSTQLNSSSPRLPSHPTTFYPVKSTVRLTCPAAFSSNAIFVSNFFCSSAILSAVSLPCACCTCNAATSNVSFSTLFLILPFWSAVAAAPDAASTAGLNASVSAASAVSRSVWRVERSAAETAARSLVEMGSLARASAWAVPALPPLGGVLVVVVDGWILGWGDCGDHVESNWIGLICTDLMLN